MSLRDSGSRAIRWAVVKGDIVENVVVADPDWEHTGAMPCPDHVAPGDVWDGREFIRPERPERQPQPSLSVMLPAENATRPTTVAKAAERLEALEATVRAIADHLGVR